MFYVAFFPATCPELHTIVSAPKAEYDCGRTRCFQWLHSTGPTSAFFAPEGQRQKIAYAPPGTGG